MDPRVEIAMRLRDAPAHFIVSLAWRFLHAVRRASVFVAMIASVSTGAVAQTSLTQHVEPGPGATDANIVTAIDASDSIGRHEEWLQQIGLTRAVIAPAFLESVAAGVHRRIGFAAFVWSSDGRFDVVVPWTIIASAEDARRVSQVLAAVKLVDRSGYGGGDLDTGTQAWRTGTKAWRTGPERQTDVSAAIDFASSILASSPHEGGRSVMNILADGADNVSVGAASARDRALDAGYTINGVAVGRSDGLMDYFKANVIGGFGAFVMPLIDPNIAGEIMARKLAHDLLAYTPNAAGPISGDAF